LCVLCVKRLFQHRDTQRTAEQYLNCEDRRGIKKDLLQERFADYSGNRSVGVSAVNVSRRLQRSFRSRRKRRKESGLLQKRCARECPLLQKPPRRVGRHHWLP